MDVDRALKIMSRVWGRRKFVKDDEEYWAFLATIRGDAQTKTERIGSWSEHAFRWPLDREKIATFLKSNGDKELYWCPNLFEVDRRHEGAAWDERCLYADLDDVDPRKVDYEPTIAWESSPGRYQAIWMFGTMTALTGASAPGHENQKLTYHLGADRSGWDTTQLLRVPGSNNYKPDYRKANGGKPAKGKILWDNRREWLPEEFADLPDVESVGALELDVLEDQIDRVDRHAVWGRVRLKVSSRVREFVAAREASGDRSDILWEIERELADAGCSVPEIVAILRPTVWNKYVGRSDELRRLITEASKAVSERGDKKGNEEALEEVDDTVDRPKIQNIFEVLRNIKVKPWLIRGILTEGALGFIAGQPKSYKSWFGLDMAFSVASGQPFLGHFDIEQRGPVLYIQEEDAPALVKQRVSKVWPGKLADKITMENGELFWLPGQEYDEDLDLDTAIMSEIQLDDPGWQSWLDEVLGAKTYRLLVMDPLMMMAGEVDENRAQEMTTKIFKPLKILARKYNVALQLVHHMRKANGQGPPQRGGQMMLGSVANHAWAEDSMFLRHARGGDIEVEVESKNATTNNFRVSGVRKRGAWEPRVTVHPDAGGDEPEGVEGPARKGTGRRKDKPKPPPNKALMALASLGPGAHTVRNIADAAGISPSGVYNAFKREQAKGHVEAAGSKFQLTSTGRELIS